MIERLIKCVVYGDLLQKMLTKNRAYEKNKGETQELFDYWMDKCKKLVKTSNNKQFKQSIYDIVNDLDGVLLEFDKIIGLDRLKAIHLNDSKNPFESHKDRHENIGLGTIGFDTLLKIMKPLVLTLITTTF